MVLLRYMRHHPRRVCDVACTYVLGGVLGRLVSGGGGGG